MNWRDFSPLLYDALLSYLELDAYLEDQAIPQPLVEHIEQAVLPVVASVIPAA